MMSKTAPALIIRVIGSSPDVVSETSTATITITILMPAGPMPKAR